MTREEAFEYLDTYGSDLSRWPSKPSAAIMRSPEFKARYDEIKSLDDALANWEEDKDGADVGEDNGMQDGQGDESDDDDNLDDPNAPDEKPAVGGGSLELEEKTDEDPEPIEIDLSQLRDTDEALAELLEKALAGAFDGTIQTDYTRDFDKIEPYPSTGVTDVSKYEAHVRSKTGVMQKDLQRLIVARSHAFNVGGFRSGRLNSPALHRVMSGDDRIFRRKVVVETQATAISLVVDCSGSMKSDDKIQTAMLSAWAFADILDRLKITHEVIGFTTKGFDDYEDHERTRIGVEEMYKTTGLPRGTIRSGPTWMMIFKGFGERFQVEQKRRMARMMETCQGMGANNDAMALEYASSRLLMQQSPRKIMIVFSDGNPADSDLRQYVIGNTMKRTIARLEKNGVETIGIGIKDASVKSYYKKHVVLNDVSQLPTLVMRELKKLLVG